jgi:hypothetical protein
MKIRKPLFWIIVVLAIVTGVLYLLSKQQQKKINKLKNEISFLENENNVPIRYKILGKKDGKLIVSVKFYDLDGKEIGKPKRYELRGNTVSFDFYVVKFDSTYLAFPKKIFTDMIKPIDGIKLYSAYEENGYPMIYSSSSKKLNRNFKSGIKDLYQKLKSGDLKDIKNVFGNMVQLHPSAADSNNTIDKNVYKIIVHTKGGIEIQQE